jgi:hypothetical protein
MASKLRSTLGTRNARAKLTDFDVLEIRRRYAMGETQYALAATFGVTQSNVSRLLGKGWRHLPKTTGKIQDHDDD